MNGIVDQQIVIQLKTTALEAYSTLRRAYRIRTGTEYNIM